MDIASPVSSTINKVEFSTYTTEEVKQISVKLINNPVSFDAYTQPLKGGLYDPCLGANEITDICDTCGLTTAGCPGHFGHIQLPFIVFNCLLFDEMMSLLRAKCFYCHSFRFSDAKRAMLICKGRLLKLGLISQAKNFERMDLSSSTSTKQKGEATESDIKNEESIDSMYRKCDKILKQAKLSDAKNTVIINSEMKEFFKQVVKDAASASCSGCKFVKVNVRHSRFQKVFQVPLAAATEIKMAKIGKKLPNVFDQSDLFQKKVVAPEQVEEAIGEIFAKDINVDLDNEEINAVEDSDVESSVNNDDEDSKIVGQTSLKKQSQVLLTPLHLLHHIHLLFKKEPELMGLLYGGPESILPDPKMFFFEVIAVPPSRYRPPILMNGNIYENTQSAQLTKIIKTTQEITTLSRNTSENDWLGKLVEAWLQLQTDVNSLLDSTRGNQGAFGKEPPAGIKQILEKKEGLFRKHMMGKRVNYAARSVISPDPNIETSEIGLPPVFAKVLTYPEPVTHFNVSKLRQSVINGPDQWPGATHVQHEDGTLTQLSSLGVESRIALANQLLTPQDAVSTTKTDSQFAPTSLGINKKVYRHIENGDVVLLNRQPTLHKPSIMAHKVRVLTGEKTIRMHYANCNTYNADFDGDEMNVHFPQNEIARAEANLIANTDNQYLVPTSGEPLRGLIQDHVASGVLMTCRDSFFTKDEYQQLLYGSIRPEDEPNRRILTVAPAIMKPRQLWTGKQIITTLMKNLTAGRVPINLTSKSRVPARYWDGAAPEEDKVIFVDGEYVTGILDKNQFGASAYGLVHTVYELYAPALAGKLLGMLSRLFTKFTQLRGFTCRMDDLRLTPEGDKWRRDILDSSAGAGMEASVGYIGLSGREKFKDFQQDFALRMEEVYRSDEKLQGLDSTMKSKMNRVTSSVIEKCIPNGLFKKFPLNHMQTMTVSGAKGSNVNVSQISCMLGQQELEGRRVPVMISGKTLPSFQPFETSARAGGFIAGRFLTGIKPQEYFFHCMAGREGLIDTAVKTSRSGYLQRCLIKHMEGLRVHYDHTVRDDDGSVMQFSYGEDGLDVIKQKHLFQFDFAANNYLALKTRYQPRNAMHNIDRTAAVKYNKKALKHPELYDPVLSLYPPSKYFGSVSEHFSRELRKYIKTKPTALNQGGEVDPDLFKLLMQLKYQHSLAEPGEAVGLLAAQSVGEPSTQMTLNTFHFAGFGAKNVTLGIPRLREIIMTATPNIKTPSMTMTVLDGVSDQTKDNFCLMATKLRLSELVDSVEVQEDYQTSQLGYMKTYQVQLNLFKREDYKKEFQVEPTLVEKSMVKFLKRLEYRISHQLRKQGFNIKLLNKETNEDGEEELIEGMDKHNNQDADELDDEEEDLGSDDEGDATELKKKGKRKQMASYEEDKANEDADDEDIDDLDRAGVETIEDKSSDYNDSDAESDMEEVLETEAANTAAVNKAIAQASKYTTSYKFDHSQDKVHLTLSFPPHLRKLLVVDLVELVSYETVVRQINNIEKVFPIHNSTSDDLSRKVSTDGSNLMGMWPYGHIIDLDSIESNDIYGILQTYGVEAARNAIQREIAGVFAVYGIEVDPRHLTLIADYMTFEGGYRAFNRYAINSCTSPFQKMSFETTVSFLTKSVLYKDLDELKSPSANLVMGKLVHGGTGSFQLVQPITVDSSSA